MHKVVIIGQVATGVGQGSYFTQLPWARQQFVDRLGIDPYPGTLNLTVTARESLKAWYALREEPGIRIDNPGNGPSDCDARCYPVTVNGHLDAVIVLPEVHGYARNQIELIAARGIRDALHVEDSDPLKLETR